MNDATPSRRTTSLAFTATTLVALVAMSASVSAAPARAVAQEARAESHVVRAVAAAMAAVARDLFGGETVSIAVLPNGPSDERTPAAALPIVHEVDAPPGRMLDERLLALPPPAC